MITNERYDQLKWLWENEDADDDSWLDDLTEEERALIDVWDRRYLSGIRKMIEAGRLPGAIEIKLDGAAISQAVFGSTRDKPQAVKE